ncbi:MAG: diadenylate cyclase CdaA [Kiritimatiellaeota bacterium]|nr:diadenylate cyclase CdaA [Kiritimatiellota bacterium]
MFWDRLHLPSLTGMLEIGLLAFAFYYLILFFRGTRGAQVLLGFVVVLVALGLFTQFLRLDVLSWVLERFSVYLVVAVIIIFQPEIRRALAELGKQHMFMGTTSSRTLVDHVVEAVTMLAGRKIGALIAIEREIGLRAVQETGTTVDAVVTPELLSSIFFPYTPLHDGGVIIRQSRLVAAGCLFPLSQREGLAMELGTRHRAAIGLTEEADALVVVVSEETGTISVAYKGRLTRGLDEEKLRKLLAAVLLRPRTARNRWRRAGATLDLTPEGVARTEAALEKELGEYG